MNSKASYVAITMSLALLACAGEIGAPRIDPLEGLESGQVQDLSGRLDAPAGSDGTFAFHGFVLTYPTVFSGNASRDSLTQWPRVQGVTISVYHLGGRDENLRPIAGTAIGSVISDANGYFRFATAIEDGEYVLASVPPKGSGLQGVYWSYTITVASANRLIGIVLPKVIP